jgi:hypothetical protein
MKERIIRYLKHLNLIDENCHKLTVTDSNKTYCLNDVLFEFVGKKLEDDRITAEKFCSDFSFQTIISKDGDSFELSKILDDFFFELKRKPMSHISFHCTASRGSKTKILKEMSLYLKSKGRQEIFKPKIIIMEKFRHFISDSRFKIMNEKYGIQNIYDLLEKDMREYMGIKDASNVKCYAYKLSQGTHFFLLSSISYVLGDKEKNDLISRNWTINTNKTNE